MYEVEWYIEEAYQTAGSTYTPYFQVQFITVNIDNIDLLAVQSAQINCFRRIKKKKKNMEKQREQQTSKGKSNNRMTQMLSSYIG